MGAGGSPLLGLDRRHGVDGHALRPLVAHVLDLVLEGLREREEVLDALPVLDLLELELVVLRLEREEALPLVEEEGVRIA